MHSFIHIIKI